MLWSAIYGQVDNIEFWGALAGPAPCEQALLALLEHPAPEARNGAANAAARLAGRMPAVVGACVTTAHWTTRMPASARRQLLCSPGMPERQTSRRLHLRSNPAADVGARSTCSRRSLRPAARSTASAVCRDCWRAGMHAGARWRRTANTIIARGRRGVLVGFLASAGWTATIGLLMACVATWATGEIGWFFRHSPRPAWRAPWPRSSASPAAGGWGGQGASAPPSRASRADGNRSSCG